MGILGIILLVLFAIVAVLLIVMVILQDEGGDGLGGIFAGSSNSTFGSRTGNVITRFTASLGALFLIFALGLALVNRSGSTSGVEKAALKDRGTDSAQWWVSPAPAATPSGSPATEGALGAPGTPLPAPKAE
jgi:preprotein translocase subunit SecG